MTLTILFDLDDTLLENDLGKFQKHYLLALADALKQYASKEEIIRQVMQATVKMAKKAEIAGTMEDIFDRSFYPAIGVSKKAMETQITRFYRDDFPALRPLTSPRKEMIEIVQRAFLAGWKVSVATQPVFPKTAIYQRLAWAQLSADENAFSTVTTYEDLHFCKPDPAYFAETLMQMGWPDQPAVMVGNSLEDDILPAVTLGLPAFLLVKDLRDIPADLPALTAAGTMAELWSWLVSQSDAEPQVLPLSPASLLARLKAAPAALKTLTRNFSAADWQQRPDEKAWNAVEISCHLRDIDREVNDPRFQQVLAEDQPFITGVITDQWVEERAYNREDGFSALDGFVRSRQQLLKILEPLEAADWQREARHTIFGPTTLAELVSFICTHDRSHVQQILECKEDGIKK